jgi:tetratricopeptide (TPR) repeat protein
MKKTVVVLIAILASFSAFSQKMPSDYFEEASNYFEEEELDKALEGYQYIVDNYPKNELYPRAFYNVGYIYFVQEHYDKAILVFIAILENNFNEKENLGGDIMADPYTNYKHRAGRILSNIYYEKQMFDTALYYFALADTVYPYLHFCGNEYAENDVYTSLRYADIYQKLNQPNKAIEKLLPSVFITLADNSTVIKELQKLLADRKNLKKKLDKSLKNIYSRTIKREGYTYIKYYFKFFNVEIDVPNSYEKRKFDKEKAVSKIKQTDFYKMIEQL